MTQTIKQKTKTLSDRTQEVLKALYKIENNNIKQIKFKELWRKDKEFYIRIKICYKQFINSAVIYRLINLLQYPIGHLSNIYVRDSSPHFYVTLYDDTEE